MTVRVRTIGLSKIPFHNRLVEQLFAFSIHFRMHPPSFMMITRIALIVLINQMFDILHCRINHYVMVGVILHDLQYLDLVFAKGASIAVY